MKRHDDVRIGPENPLIVRGGNQDPRHCFLGLSPAQPSTLDVNGLATYLLNRWGNTSHSTTAFRSFGRLRLEWTAHNKVMVRELTHKDLSSYLRLKRGYDSEHDVLPPLACDWLDGPIGAFAPPDTPIATHKRDYFLAFAMRLPYGDAFPVEPCVDREGVMWASLQYALASSVLSTYQRLVDQSHDCFSVNEDWLNLLRLLCNDCVSVVDVTLHQLYYMAQYRASEMGWQFDKAKLDKRPGQRLVDKLKWIGTITTRYLCDAKAELNDFNRIRELRNHLNHFDPPCFAFTGEDAERWLNLVPTVGRLLWKIRDKLRAQLNTGIVRLVLLPTVTFSPRDDQPRTTQRGLVGYASSIWPKDGVAPSRSPRMVMQASSYPVTVTRCK